MTPEHEYAPHGWMARACESGINEECRYAVMKLNYRHNWWGRDNITAPTRLKALVKAVLATERGEE